MKKMILLLSVIICWHIAGPLQAEVWINNLALEKQDGFIGVKIYGTESFEFTHATEEAKSGKPFRIYVDCQNAIFGLPQYKYFDLPTQTVKAIRSAQFKAEPQKIVRVVVDCSRPVTYKVNSQDNWVEISISSGQEPEFGRWEALQKTDTQLASSDKTHEQKTSSEKSVVAKARQASARLTLPEVKVQAEEPETKTVAKQEHKAKSALAENVKPAIKEEQTKPKTLTQITNESRDVESKTTKRAARSQAKEKVVTSQSERGKESGKVTSPAEKSKGSLQLPAQTPATASQKAPLILTPRPQEEQWQGFAKREKVKYSSKGRRDPFSPLLNFSDDYEFGVAPLPTFQSLSLVGILQSFGQNLALLEDSRGFGYILQAGDRIKDGRVLRVDQDRVIFQVSEYGWTRNISLELYN
jgi:hypothetical protein